MEALTTRMPWETTYIVPIGDIQYGGMGVDISTLERDVKRGLAHNAWFTGLGDFTDVESPSGRAKLKAAGLYESVMIALDKQTMSHIDDLMDILGPTRGRWLSFCHGHHYHDYRDGTTTDTRLAKLLGAPYTGTSYLHKLQFQRGNASVVDYVMYGTHGVGSGITQSAPLNKLERLSGGIEADIYLINHYARKGAVPADRLYLDRRGDIAHRRVHYVATGGYMTGYTQGSKIDRVARGSYVEEAMMKPTTMGGVLITIEPERTTRNYVEHLGLEVTVTV